MKIVSDLDINGNKVQNLVIESLERDPQAVQKGYLYFNETIKAFRYFDGEDWITVQEGLISGENIKTINSESILGTGNIALQPHIYYRGKWNTWASLPSNETLYPEDSNHQKTPP